jgi:hypothetical protein
VLGATNSTLILTNVLFEDTGEVSVVVSNGYGSVSSRLAMLQPVPPPALMRVAGDGAELRFHLTALLPNGTYRLMSSTNLVDWLPLQNVVSPNSTLELTIPKTNGPLMFYRLRFLNP